MIKEKKMKFETDYIEKLAKIITDNGLTEISLEDGEQAITIRKDLPEVTMASVPSPIPVCTPAAPAAAAETEAAPAPKGKAITSPMVGTFYIKPSPDSKPYVEVGSNVKKGNVLCIIEAMKLMNEIESEFDGKISEIYVKDGEPVEYGKPLFKII